MSCGRPRAPFRGARLTGLRLELRCFEMSGKSGEREEWAMLHFSQANPKGGGQDDVAALLIRVAESIRALGAVDVHDITFHDETDDEGQGWPTMSVYYSRQETTE